jgi:hypothetical protein
VAQAQGEFWNPDEVECLPLETITKGLVKTQLTEKTCMHAVVNC